MIYHILKSSDTVPRRLSAATLTETAAEFLTERIFLSSKPASMQNFLLLRPTVGVVLNIDNDHLEVYKTEKKSLRVLSKNSPHGRKRQSFVPISA